MEQQFVSKEVEPSNKKMLADDSIAMTENEKKKTTLIEPDTNKISKFKSSFQMRV